MPNTELNVNNKHIVNLRVAFYTRMLKERSVKFGKKNKNEQHNYTRAIIAGIS